VLLGAALGYALGLLVDRELLLMPLGALAGLVLGFYAVYVRFIR
jgi:F0F1-type ATP synthase assembly protein I